jgi:hypothetical protein
MARQASHHGSRAVIRFEYPRQECAEIKASVQTVAENQRKQQMNAIPMSRKSLTGSVMVGTAGVIAPLCVGGIVPIAQRADP